MVKKITTEAVAEMLGTTPQTVRYALRNGELPFGTAFKRPGSSKWTYLIYPEKLREYLG